ncbi:MAG TPA: hypothetical protein VGD72_12655 [Mycobacteriales bacterium]
MPVTSTMDSVALRPVDPALAAPGAQAQWDLDSMQSTVSFLEAQRDNIAALVGQLNRIAGLLGRADSTPLGGFAAARQLYAQHETVWQGVRSALQSTRDQLDETAAGTRRIIENYRTTEERNRASAEDVAKLLTTGGPVAPASADAPVRPDSAGGEW